MSISVKGVELASTGFEVTSRYCTVGKLAFEQDRLTPRLISIFYTTLATKGREDDLQIHSVRFWFSFSLHVAAIHVAFSMDDHADIHTDIHANKFPVLGSLGMRK